MIDKKPNIDDALIIITLVIVIFLSVFAVHDISFGSFTGYAALETDYLIASEDSIYWSIWDHTGELPSGKIVVQDLDGIPHTLHITPEGYADKKGEVYNIQKGEKIYYDYYD